MSTFQIRKYDAGSAESKLVSVCVDGDVLRIVDSDEAIPLNELELDVGGHLGDRIKLTCRSSGVLMVADDRALLDALGAADGDGALALQARSALKKLTALPHSHTRYWLIVAAVSLASVVGLYLAMDYAAQTIISGIDPGTESKLGRLIANEDKLDSTSADAKRVQRIGAKLVKHLEGNPYEFHFFVEKEEEINAYAVPGGYIVVNSLLVKQADSDDELAGVLAHEIGHVVHRDTLKRMGHTVGLVAMVSLITGMGMGGNDAQKLADFLQLGTNLESLNYSRGQETAADITGLRLVVKAGYDPEGLITFFQKLQKEHGSGDSKILGLLSTHPMTSERVAAIRAELARLKQTEGKKPSSPARTSR